MTSLFFDPMFVLCCARDADMRAWAVRELDANGFEGAEEIERDLRLIAGAA